MASRMVEHYLLRNLQRELKQVGSAFEHADHELRRTQVTRDIAKTSGNSELHLNLRKKADSPPWGRQRWVSKAGLRHSHHIYEALDSSSCEIRLLTLFPPRRGLVYLLECSLETVSLASKPGPRYETISYSWNDPTKRTDILLNGKLFSVHASAVQALFRVRLSDTPRVLWIDGICINQQSDVERSSQVRLMGRIYASSVGNLVYLGEQENSTEQGLLDIEALTTAAMKYFDQAEGPYLPDDMPLRDTPGAHETTLLAFRALLDFYQAKWFTRLWVLQEAALAPSNRCFCGPFEFDLYPVLAVADWLMRNGPRHCRYQPMDPKEVSGVAHMYSIVESRRRRYIMPGTLSSLLRVSKTYKATDPRDKLFGILGLLPLSSVSNNSTIRSITYNNTTVEVYSAATKAAIINDNGLHILQSVSHRDTADLEALWAPTWAHKDIVWNWKHDPMPLDRFNASPSGHFSTSKFESDNKDPHILRLRGWQIDTVSNVVVSLTFEDFCDLGVAFHKLEAAFDMEAPTGDDVIGYVMDTLLSEPAMVAITNAPLNSQTTDLVTNLLERLQDPEKERERQLQRALGIELAKVCINRSLFLTEQGRLGVGPKTMMMQDTLVAFRGGGTPFVVRRHRGRFVLVGHCYANGIMEEQWPSVWNVQDEERTFELY